jgi:hypothetical protein
MNSEWVHYRGCRGDSKASCSLLYPQLFGLSVSLSVCFSAQRDDGLPRSQL